MRKNRSRLFLFIPVLFSLTVSCRTASVPGKEPVTVPQNYEDLGLNPDKVEVWEDGLRTSGEKGTYEWWYTDAEFDDGTTIVTVFFTKNGFDVSGRAQPTVTINITRPDGSELERTFQLKKGILINASREYCDVEIGRSYLKYDKGNYVIHYEDEEITYHARMESLLPMYRPGTGQNFYGSDGKYFAWLAAQPSSRISAELTLGGEVQTLKGAGYHDHNWGNTGMQKLMNHWYWGRASIGGYTIISSDVITSQKYGYIRLPNLMVAKNGEILQDPVYRPVSVIREDTVRHPETGKFMDNRIIYTRQIGDRIYQVEYNRRRDILNVSFLDMLKPLPRLLAKAAGANPTYTRILGDVTIREMSLQGTVLEEVSAEGLWEQMFFGNNKEAYIYEYPGTE